MYVLLFLYLSDFMNYLSAPLRINTSVLEPCLYLAIISGNWFTCPFSMLKRTNIQ